MAWLEMSRDEMHGGKGWAFGECLWCPTQRRGGGRWGYWELMRSVRAGDTVIHLRGRQPDAFFVGVSVAETDAFETTRRPPEPGEWDHAQSFLRVPLRDFVPFDKQLALTDVFRLVGEQLLKYHAEHSPASSPDGRKLFFVSQGGRLQCQNGAYLSEIDEELSGIIFGESDASEASVPAAVGSVETGNNRALVSTRVGQQRFSESVRDNYGHRCCFPDCVIKDRQLLVASHIARWADSPDLRGNVSNGICLCVLHDKAFEVGFFTLAVDGTVYVNDEKAKSSEWAQSKLVPIHGRPIREGAISPSIDALRLHWDRLGLELH